MSNHYLKLLAKIKDDLEALREKKMLPEMVVIPSGAEMEENKGLIEKLLGVPVKIDVGLDSGYKIGVKVDFEF